MITTVNSAGRISRAIHRDVLFTIAAVLFSTYLLVLAKILFFQFDFHWINIHIVIRRNCSAAQLLAKANLMPFYKIIYYLKGSEPYSVGLLNVVGNVALFLPMGWGLSYLFTQLQNVKQFFITVVLFSLSVELLQLITATGVFDVDDVILNAAGALIGFWMLNGIKSQKSKVKTSTVPTGSFDF